MKFLIAGLGSIGRRHLRNLLALGETDILLYRTHQSTLPDDELASFPTYTDFAEALAQKPDAVIVSNPTALHLEVAIPAARAGCNLLLEKPISDQMERIPELVEAVATGGGKVLVGFQFRFHPGLQQVRQLITENVVGNPISVRAHWGEYLPGWHPWEDYRTSYAARAELGGGVVRTLCHPFDYLRWLFGEIESVYATLRHSGELEIDVEDTAEVQMRFVSGLIGSVHLDYLQRPPAHTLEIVGSQGTIRWDNATEEVLLYRVDSKAGWQKFPAPEGFERNHMFVNLMKHFCEVLRAKTAPRCSLHDGIMAQRIIEAVYQSASSRSPIAP